MEDHERGDRPLCHASDLVDGRRPIIHEVEEEHEERPVERSIAKREATRVRLNHMCKSLPSSLDKHPAGEVRYDHRESRLLQRCRHSTGAAAEIQQLVTSLEGAGEGSDLSRRGLSPSLVVEVRLPVEPARHP